MHKNTTSKVKFNNWLVRRFIDRLAVMNCVDIDECATDNGRCSHHADCVNTNRSFNCSCRDGYHGERFRCIGKRILVWDALDPRNVYLNTVYFKLSNRMCNLVAKIVDYIAWCRQRHGQTDRRTDGRHNNGVTNHEADAVKRSISLTTLVKQYNLILLVWEGNRGSNPIMNLHCRRLTPWVVWAFA